MTSINSDMKCKIRIYSMSDLINSKYEHHNPKQFMGNNPAMHHPDVSIAEVITKVTISQVYKNEGENPIEAIRLINLTNKLWKPAEKSGKKVKSGMLLVVEFKLR